MKLKTNDISKELQTTKDVKSVENTYSFPPLVI